MKTNEKRFVVLMLALFMALSVVGCAFNDEAQNEETSYSASADVFIPDVDEQSENEKEEDNSSALVDVTETAIDDSVDNVEAKNDSDNKEPVDSVTSIEDERSIDDVGMAKEDKKIDDKELADVAKTVNNNTPKNMGKNIPNNNDEKNVEQGNVSFPKEVLTHDVEEPEDIYDIEEDETLTETQRNSINMLNYMTVLTQEINEAKGNQIFLESVYSSLVNDVYPNAVDTKTQAQITSLMDTIDGYRMITVKRDRLEYIYEQNCAQALRQAIPNPVGLLSVVQSGSALKSAASVLYMTVDFVSSYKSTTSQADLQFLQNSWELDDEESAELHSSTKNALSYMFNMVRDYDLPGDHALNQESVESFVLWSNKPDSQLVSKIAWLESHQDTYKEFGLYWLEIAKDYYNANEYEKCLAAINQYKAVSTRIFRKDIDYATVLPMAIISAKETKGESDYVKMTDQYCAEILTNTKDADWSLKYFVAQAYLDLYAITKESLYLDKAYKIALDNVIILVDEQRALNDSYLAEIQEEKADKDATKREKKEVKEYNKLIKEERKVALPPVSEALYLNCDLLFALAEKRNISSAERSKISSILHENGDSIF
ncbi:MAG: hypothetical protein NC416_08460 [Eubacterium sp.]|nr:hypothetical protein [Eubacterium sp.]